ncbi:hypothetical protein C772_02882 [Bhargavaea cecembensis DSE10]|uniref:DUF72 domain-containing protein n=1 Tax=Bhargavaea cecembensis DSE10 TaxID=1235279 RepID=M7NCY8_9BACL|nr:DUF72 domain-containing protein [Bhargavaea cecembensis]EMR05122.1 hypothetical protein C772_02882 [Bhargavaea cecembensis DSE10]
MIRVGLTGWGDHPDVYSPASKKTDKLKDYGGHFKIVELDSTFYAIQPERNIRKWIGETPDDFGFIVKAYQGMTGHHRGRLPYESEEEMFRLFRLSVGPMLEAGKLPMILAQYPPWFDCTKENVGVLRKMREYLDDLDVAVEFRHQSWYSEKYRKGTLDFLREQRFIHSVCDEPQAGDGSVPFVPEATREDKTLVRLHGRNTAGWKANGRDDKKWREVRYLYDYNDNELKGLAGEISGISSEDVFVVFNNNSGGHAAENAKRFMGIAGIETARPGAQQLDLFGGEDL